MSPRDSRQGSTRSLLKAAGKLKEIKRKGWIAKAGIPNPESVADHSYRTALLAALISIESGLDQAKLVRMCLIHDLAESEMGDLMPEEKESEASHRKREDAVMRRLLGALPRKTGRVLLADWEELLRKRTRESKAAWWIDKLEMALQASDYIAEGYDRKKLLQFKSGMSAALRQILAAKEE